MAIEDWKESTDGEGAAPNRVLFESRNEFQAAIRNAFAQAAEVGCRELWLCDVNFANWPLGEIKVVEELTQWGYAHRKLTLFALDFDEFARRHVRWVEWRRKWAHIVECRALKELEASQVPTIFLAPGLTTVRLFDSNNFRGSASSLKSDEVSARELLDAVSQRSVEAFPATTLGL
ncbi:hypothetical protein BH09PSE5_BH09PSE5_06010 [soil metagenome]